MISGRNTEILPKIKQLEMHSTEDVTNLSNSSLNNSLTFFISNCLISNSTEIFPKIKQLENTQYWKCDQPKQLLFNQLFNIFYKQLLYKQQYWDFAKN